MKAAPASHGVEQFKSVQRRTLAVLSLSQIIGGLGVAVGLAFSSLIVEDLSGSVTISGFAGTAMVLGSALFALPIAKVATISGRRASLALGYASAAVGGAVATLAIGLGSWPLVLVGFLLIGAGSTTNLAARYSATDLSPKGTTARHLSLVVWATTIGSVAGPNLAQPADAIGKNLGLAEYAGPFAFATFAFLVALLFLFFFLRPDPLKLARTVSTGGGEVPKRVMRAGWDAIRSSAGARAAVLAIAISHTAMVSIMSMTPVHLKHGGATTGIIGLALSLHIAGMYVFSPLVGWLADKAGKIPVLVLGMAILLGSAVLAMTAGEHSVGQITASLILLGLGWSCGLVAGSALLTESTPIGQRASVQGLSDLLVSVCGATGTVVAGLIVGGLSYSALGIAVGIVVTATGVWLAARRRALTAP
ncbi:MFS transporter [Nonomuraea soli]|uniref:MFS family permease n=1 Tax=Nonomuraea soli TaxID=1032476 RepID=A0A7W0CNU9_9ACTN|nr:MFS transporter [Nonomuraea soli]MBA2894582.1 MFS family permease [Nonomuraea soli]